MKKYIFIAISILLYLGIYWFSSKPAPVSSQQSDNVIVKMKIMTEKEIKEEPARASKTRFTVRKLAHFSIYGVLGVFVFLSVCSFVESNLLAFLIALPLTSILAAIDEFHQSMVPGRSMELRDVMIDTLGAASFILVIIIILKLLNKNKKSSNVYYYGNNKLQGM